MTKLIHLSRDIAFRVVCGVRSSGQAVTQYGSKTTCHECLDLEIKRLDAMSTGLKRTLIILRDRKKT